MKADGGAAAPTDGTVNDSELVGLDPDAAVTMPPATAQRSTPNTGCAGSIPASSLPSRYYFDFRGDINRSPTGVYMLAMDVIPLLRQCEETLAAAIAPDTVEEILDAEALVEATLGDLRRVLCEIDR